MHLLRLFALALRNQGADVIDQCTKVLTEWQSLSEASTFLKNKGVTLPAAVTNEAIKDPFDAMQFFPGRLQRLGPDVGAGTEH